MKGAYTLEEVKKPFVIPRISFSPDYEDPQVKQLLLQSAAMATASIYGPALVGRGKMETTLPVIEIAAPKNGDKEQEEVVELPKEKTQEEKDIARIHILKDESQCSEELYRKTLKMMGAVDKEGNPTSKVLTETQRPEFIAWLEELPVKEEDEEPDPMAPTPEEREETLQRISKAMKLKITFGSHDGESLGELFKSKSRYLTTLASDRFQPADDQERIAIQEAAKSIRWAEGEGMIPEEYK